MKECFSDEDKEFMNEKFSLHGVVTRSFLIYMNNKADEFAYSQVKESTKEMFTEKEINLAMDLCQMSYIGGERMYTKKAIIDHIKNKRNEK